LYVCAVADEGSSAGVDQEGPDPFADLVLDDAFVQSASRSAPPAAHRAPTRPHAPPRRRSRRPRGQCAALGTQYAGGALPSGSNWGWLGMSPADWTAGERTVACTVGDFDASGNPVARTGSLRG
jgi:hypothetical protein